MKKLTLVAAVALAVCALQACHSGASNTSSDSASTTTTTTKTDTIKADSGKMTASTLSKDDSTFVMKAANGGMAEVALSKLAQTQASSNRVKSFAAMMISDHSKANDKLKAIARSKGIMLPDTISGDEQKMYTKLSAKTGSDFDKEYVKGMVMDHKDAVKLFEKGSNDLKDPDLKNFATTTLPTLKMHLDSIEAIKKALNY